MATDSGLEFEKDLVELEKRIEELKQFTDHREMNMGGELQQVEERAQTLRKKIYSQLTPWQIVQLSRHPKRPHTLDYIREIFDQFTEMHGDRAFIDDRAMVGGVAWLHGKPVTVLGTQKGKDTKENIACNFGLPLPEGYRKALRLMKFAEKFGMPVVTFIDTAGAYPGLEGEERGVAEAIARNLREMSSLRTPIIVVVIGEGGSGGALGIGVGDHVLMLSNAMYTVITPEGCAAILWKDRTEAPRASEILKITAPHLKKLGVIDEIIDEPLGGAHREPAQMIERVRDRLSEHIGRLSKIPVKKLLDQRYRKFRQIGFLTEMATPTPPDPAPSESPEPVDEAPEPSDHPSSDNDKS